MRMGRPLRPGYGGSSFCWNGQWLAFLGYQHDEQLHSLALSEVDCLVDVGRVFRVGLEVQLCARRHVDGWLADLLHSAMAGYHIDEFLAGMVMLAASPAGLVFRDEDGDLLVW